MNTLNTLFMLLLSCILVSLFGCSGRGDSRASTNGNGPTQGLVANAGADQEVKKYSIVTLEGSAISASDTDTLTYAWKQLAGPLVRANSYSGSKLTFTAPAVQTSLSFSLTVSDEEGNSATDVVSIKVGQFCKSSVWYGDYTANDDLTSLSKYTEIDGTLTLSNSLLNSLEGLNCLESITGDFYMHNNFYLVDIQALQNLQFIGGCLQIYENPSLEDLTGLQNLRFLGSGLYISIDDLEIDLETGNKLVGLGLDKENNIEQSQDLSLDKTNEPIQDVNKLFKSRYDAFEHDTSIARIYQNGNVYSGEKNILVKNPNERGGAGVKFIFLLDAETEYKLIFHGMTRSRIVPSLRLQLNDEEYIYSTLPMHGSKVLHIGGAIRVEMLIYSEYGFEYEIQKIGLYPSISVKRDGSFKPFLSIFNITLDNEKISDVTEEQIRFDLGLNGIHSFNEVVAAAQNFVYINSNTGIATHRKPIYEYDLLKNGEFYGLCTNIVDMFSWILSVLGIQSRIIHLQTRRAVEDGIVSDAHSALEVYDVALNAWILSDPTFNAFFKISGSDTFSSAEELAVAVEVGKDIETVYWYDEIKDGRTVETYYLTYESLLYRIVYP